MVTARRPREGAHDVRHGGLGRNHAEGKLMCFQEADNVCGGARRVTGWVRTLRTDEVAQKIDDLLAILVNPPRELPFQSVHGVLLLGKVVDDGLDGSRKN
jgi:hypothetical protein